MASHAHLSELDYEDQDVNISNGSYWCQHPGCDEVFVRHRDLVRHSITHDPAPQRRGCPYPNSGCGIMSDAKYQLSNWYEHIVTKHGGYRYTCRECGKDWACKQGLYRHEKSTGHPCHPSEWDGARLEHELTKKNKCYQDARAELLQMWQDGRANMWDYPWPEILPEFNRFIKRKQKDSSSQNRTRSSGNHHSYVEAAWSSSAISPPNFALEASPYRERDQRFQPYIFLYDPRSSLSVPSDTSLQAAPLDVPREFLFQNFSAFGSQVSALTIPTSFETLDMSLPELPLKQEDPDKLYDLAPSGGSPTRNFGYPCPRGLAAHVPLL